MEIVDQALAAGCRWIMVREKDLGRAALVEIAAEIVDVAVPLGARVVINGNIDAAVEVGAPGAHVQSAAAVAQAREALGKEALVGVSAHHISEAVLAADCGADYATISPVFATSSKPGYGPRIGLRGLRRICRAAPLPIIALGGLTPGNASACMEVGAAGIATMGGIMRSTDPALATGDFIDALI